MAKDKLIINTELIGKGKERSCYLHPQDAGKLIKISREDVNTQSKREIDFYKTLINREVDYSHLPRFHGEIETDHGQGFIVDIVRDHDGEVSKSMLWYMENGYELADFEPYLEELKDYLLNNLIIFTHDLYPGNMLFQKFSETEARLVVIDGIGDTVFIKWLNFFPSHVRSKINRRWDYIINRMYKRNVEAKKPNS